MFGVCVMYVCLCEVCQVCVRSVLGVCVSCMSCVYVFQVCLLDVYLV